MAPAPHIGISHARSRRDDRPRTLGALAAALAMCVLVASPASAAQTIRLVLGVGGQPQYDSTSQSNIASIERGGSSGAGAWNAYLEGRAYGSGQVGAKAFVSGTLASNARVVATSSPGYFLDPPDGVNYAGGTLVVYAALVGGDIRGNASMDLGLDVKAHWSMWTASGSAHRTIGNQPGAEEVEFEVVVALPTALDSTSGALVDFNMVLDALASIAPSGGQAQTAIADALNAGRITGFRVRNAAGAQLPGFTLTGSGGKIPELAPPPVGYALAVEFYNAAFAHFFISTNPDEIAKLDSGAIPGWQRTGQSFNVYATPGTGLAAVCRFFSASFAPKSSHFYTPSVSECAIVKTNPNWLFEAEVFNMILPSAAGLCPAGTKSLYRLYNDGMGGAPNHRYTTETSVRVEMITAGWTPEGLGIGVVGCVP